MASDPDIRRQMFDQLAEKRVFDRAAAHARSYLDATMDRPVFPDEKAVADLAVFDESLPASPQDPVAILDLLHGYGSPATVSQTGGRYFGFVCGSATPVGMAAKWLSDVWDQNPALFVLSPVVAKLEAVCQEWLRDLFGLPRETVAGFVSGTSTATLCGLAAGRQALLSRQGWDVNGKGMAGAPPLRVVLGEQAHATVFKALALLGIGTGNLERVAVDDQGCLDLDSLPALDASCLVILQAGNVNSGGFDPIDAVTDHANKVGAWVHIDGAFGLWTAGSGRTRHLTRGIHKADSWSVDAHKTLNVPYDCGIVLCRDDEALVRAMQLSGSYIQYSDRRDSMVFTPEMSRRNRVVELWATLRYFGKSGIQQLLDGLCDRAGQFAARLSQEGFEVLNRVDFNQVLVACETDEETVAVLERLQASGECWCGGAQWKGRSVIRISVCSWATTPDDVERSVAAFVRARA